MHIQHLTPAVMHLLILFILLCPTYRKKQWRDETMTRRTLEPRSWNICMVAKTQQLHLQTLFPSLKPLNQTWSQCRFSTSDLTRSTLGRFLSGFFFLFFFSPSILHRAFYSKNLYGSKVRRGERFTQAKKTRHYTPHNVWKSFFHY